LLDQSLPTQSREDSMLARLADITFRRRRLVLAGWVAALVAVVALGGAVRGDWSADYSTPGSESRAAVDLLHERFPERSADTVDVVWQAPGGAQAPAARERMDGFLREAAALDGVATRPRRAAPRSRPTGRSPSRGCRSRSRPARCRWPPASG
jgi:putative drug exporter of the RND superfamily